ncbi:hypothetical protein MNBD_NITROSPINAE02-2158 [hydrothermal vent metagenome]|uniref:YhdP central domain-containing protein n=1 Tax=hydrothermal vent metagenome TaxID=652676 RepID=A0A3B1CAG9_9ZZZZ
MKSKPEPGDSAKRPDPKKYWFKRTPLAAGFIYFVALGIAFLYVLPAMFEAERYKSFVLDIISKAIQTDITAENIDLHLLDGPGITFDNIVISRGNRPIATVKKIKADINIWESLKGDISITRLKVEDPVIRLVRRRDGSFNFPALDRKAGAKQPAVMLAAATLLHAFEMVTLDNATIEWVDRHASLSPVRISLSKLNARLARGDFRGPSMINISGELKSKGNRTKFNIAGGVTHLDKGATGDADIGFNGRASIGKLDVQNIWPYISGFLPFQRLDCILSWDGTFSGGFSRGFKSKGRLGLFALGIRYREAFSEDVKPQDALIDYVLTGTRKRLDISSMRMRMGQLDVKAKGNISRLDTFNPVINASFSTNEMEVSELKKLLPDKVLTPQQSTFITSNTISGKVALRDFSFKGDLEKLRNLDNPDSLRAFTGALFVSGMRFAFHDLSFPFDDIHGFVSLKENKLALSKISGKYGKSKIEEISGEISRIHDWPDFNVRIIADLDLEEARQLLALRVTSPEFRWHINALKDIEGSIKWDIVVTGNAEDPIKTVALDGKVLFDKVGFYHPSFGLPIYDLTGLMEMDLNDMQVESITWKAGSSPFELSGVLKDVFKEDPSFDFTLLSDIFLDDINKTKLITFGDVYDQSGQALVKLKLKGDFKKFEIFQWLDATEAEYRFENLIRKEKGVKNIFTFKGSVRNIDSIQIDRLVLQLGESKVVMTGKVDEFLRGQELNLTFSTDGVLLNDLDRFLVPFQNIDGGGYINGWLSIVKEKSDETTKGRLKLDGKLIMDNADFKLPIFAAAFREVDAQFDLVGGRIFLSNGKGRFGKGKFTVTGHGRLDDPPEFNLNVKADSLYLDDFIGKDQFFDKTEEIDISDGIEKLPGYLERGSWNIVGISKTGDISNITYHDLSTTISINNNNFHISPIYFSAYGGTWQWNGDVALGADKMILIDSVANIQDFAIDGYLKEVYHSEKQITGKMNLNGKISSAGKSWEEIKRGMEGSIAIHSDEGVIHRFEILSKIFSLLNVSQYFRLKAPDLSVDGMPYTGITANFAVKDGVATTDDLMVDSEAMRISSVGDYDIATGEVDMRVGVMPFVAIDRVVSAVPVVGYVFAGEKESFIASYYLVTGPISWAKVEAIPLQSIAMGVAGILKRFIMLPAIAVEAIIKNMKEPDSKKKKTAE